MKTVIACILGIALCGPALAQGAGGGGSGGSGGTDTGPGGINTGRDSAAQNPTVEQCKQGWSSGMRWSQSEFKMLCEKK